MANGSSAPTDATAQTLNYALGNLGGGTRSWMLPASSNTMPASWVRVEGPVPSAPPAQPTTPAAAPRRRGRPPKHARPEPPPGVATAQAPDEPQTERQPPSTSASPHLPNRLTGQDRRLSVTVLPSPSPSVENAPLPNASNAGAPASPNCFSLERVQTDGAVNDTADAASAIRAMRQSKRPSTDMNAQAPKRPHLGRDGHPPWPTTTSASANSQHAAISRPQSTGTFRALSNQAPSTPNPHAQPMRPQPMLSSRFPLSPQGPYHPAVATFNMPVQNIQHTTWYTSVECLQMLDAFVQSRGAARASLQGDRGRLNVLRTAIVKEDWMYLMIHQMYCLQDVQASALPRRVLSQPAWPDALNMLGIVLGQNHTLSGPVQQMFANFPCPIHTLQARWPHRFNELLAKFIYFVFCSSRYPVFKKSCLLRRYPPLVSELVEYMAIESPVLQQTIFTSILREICRQVSQSEFKSHHENQAVQYFLQSQTEFGERRMRSAEQGQHQLGQPDRGDKWDDKWKALLKQVIEACMSGEGAQGSSAPTQVAAFQQQQRQQPQIQQIVSLQQNVSSRDNPMAQRPQVPAAPFPNHPRHTGRPQPQPVPPSLRLQPQSRPITRLLPAPRLQLSQQRQPNPARFSLHQAHLRSPVPKALSMKSRLYQYVEGFLRSPARLTTANRAIEKWTFTLNANLLQTIATTVPGALGQADQRLVDETTKTLRLRSVKWTASDRPEDHIWATMDTSWPPYSCFKLNGVLLEQRKKVHHGKDLPIDITKFVKEGENVLETMVTTDSRDKSFLDYLVAIEFLGITCHETIKRECLEVRFETTEEIVTKLKTKLASGSDEDDDIAIVDSKLTINLFDPFSASRMCDIPVRSRVCLHNDCFDLETFLGTRRRKGDVSDPDLWRCPICKADARPGYLITDGFLVDVKKMLDAQGQSKTRAIVVYQDGSWKPKEEVRDPNGVSDDPPTPTVRRASAATDIIDISD